MQNNNANSYEMRWGTRSPLVCNDKTYGALLFNIQGNCSYETTLENIDELKIQENSHLFINDFNNENLIKSIELQENIANSVLTSSYFTLRLS